MKKRLILLSIFLSTIIISATQIKVPKKTDRFINKIAENLNLEQEYNRTKNIFIDMNMGSSNIGEKLYKKKIQKHCEMSAINFSGMHSQDEWEEIVEAGKFSDKIIEICPKLKGIYQHNWSPSLYQFSYEYASDSGNIPSN